MASLVSILIPAYNAGPWIAQTIRSALAQTWPSKEIIVIDDGSSDNTLAVARQFESSGVKVLTQLNQGAAVARNKAFSVCNGDYIQWLDADDLLAPDKIEHQMKRLEKGPDPSVLLSGAWGHFYYRPWKSVFRPTELWADQSPRQWLLASLTNGMWMQPASWLVSRKLTEAAGGWDERLTLDDDGEYFCRVVLASKEIRFVPESKVFYRRTVSSLSAVTPSSRKFDSQFHSISLQVEHARQFEDSPEIRQACAKCLERYLVWFYPERMDLVGKANEVATKAGFKLNQPTLPVKYQWIQRTLGWRAAKRAQFYYNTFKSRLHRTWDKGMSLLPAGAPSSGRMSF